jgi:hypothetical protein
MQAHSGLVVDANAMLATLKHQLNLLDKQIRMLSELADAAPVVHQQRMREIVDQMKQQVQMIKIAVGAVSEGNA